ncbi:hypothetical protein AB6A40_006374 [Gnathostoma spinigerum]|uniref:Uncharacterized protein n=1 Tax=Gnathostoma spinigerum TaxID=75299 RepID=A0ABD6ETU7_9BILA
MESEIKNCETLTKKMAAKKVAQCSRVAQALNELVEKWNQMALEAARHIDQFMADASEKVHAIKNSEPFVVSQSNNACVDSEIFAFSTSARCARSDHNRRRRDAIMRRRHVTRSQPTSEDSMVSGESTVG